MIVRDLDVVSVRFAPDETDPPLVVDPVLCCPVRSRSRASKRLPGGTRRSARLLARSSINMFFRAARRTSEPRPFTGTSWNTALVRLSAIGTDHGRYVIRDVCGVKRTRSLRGAARAGRRECRRTASVKRRCHWSVSPSMPARRIRAAMRPMVITLSAIRSVAIAVIVGFTWRISSLNMRLGMVS